MVCVRNLIPLVKHKFIYITAFLQKKKKKKVIGVPVNLRVHKTPAQFPNGSSATSSKLNTP